MTGFLILAEKYWYVQRCDKCEKYWYVQRCDKMQGPMP